MLYRLLKHTRHNTMCFILFHLSTTFCTMVFKKDALLLHNVFVSYALVSILLDIEEVFKKLKIFWNEYRLFIISISFLQSINPILIFFGFRFAVYSLLIVSFIVHVLHMHYITMVFREMKYKDKAHLKILLLLNVSEIFTNVCFICDHNFTYEYVAVLTESMCAYIIVYVTKKQKRNNHRTSRIIMASTLQQPHSPQRLIRTV